jgi:hypothetical protein
MGEIESVVVTEEWVYRDLSSSNFSKEEAQIAVDATKEVRDHLTNWDRAVHNTLDQITHASDKTVYKQRKGPLRIFYIREGSTMYCIGVGKRGVVYDRDLSQIVERAENHPP